MNDAAGVEIGRVVEVNGERALVELLVDTTVPIVDEYYPGQPGTHVKIPFREQNVIGIVSSIRIVDTPIVNGASLQNGSKKVADCVLLGTLDKNGKFSRGVSVYPNVGQKVNIVTAQELDKIFSEYVNFGFSFGRPAHAENQRAYIQVDRFFGQHIAVLGTTGCGKSCTVVSILQRALEKFSNTHIVVLDLHGEYAAAFPNDAFLIDAEKVELPYWLLNFDEFVDLTVDVNEPTAKNQITVLRDAMTRARQNADSEEKLGFGKTITADSPVYFDLDEMIGMLREWNIQMVYDQNGVLQQGPLYGAFDRFLIRFESKLSDPRYNFMFHPLNYQDSSSLASILREYLSINSGKKMAIVDLSGVPSEAVGVVVAVVSRIVFEFNLWNPVREQFPILLVLEEAHNYVPNRQDARFTAARAAIERLTKEGRKYGIGLIVVSQRPKELSETVLSQCNTFIAMRLTNPDDQNYVRRLVPDSLSGLMTMLPALRTGEALILGDSVAMPTRVMIDCPDPKPQSGDIEFARWWTEGAVDLDIERVVKRWRARRRDL